MQLYLKKVKEVTVNMLYVLSIGRYTIGSFHFYLLDSLQQIHLISRRSASKS